MSKRYKVLHTKGAHVLAERAIAAESFWARFRGLMFITRMENFDAIIFDRNNSIHTFFMRFDLDVIFLDSENCVVKVLRNLKPWRMTRFYFKARKTIEFVGGKLPLGLAVGDRLEVVCINSQQ